MKSLSSHIMESFSDKSPVLIKNIDSKIAKLKTKALNSLPKERVALHPRHETDPTWNFSTYNLDDYDDLLNASIQYALKKCKVENVFIVQPSSKYGEYEGRGGAQRSEYKRRIFIDSDRNDQKSIMVSTVATDAKPLGHGKFRSTELPTIYVYNNVTISRGSIAVGGGVSSLDFSNDIDIIKENIRYYIAEYMYSNYNHFVSPNAQY